MEDIAAGVLVYGGIEVVVPLVRGGPRGLADSCQGHRKPRSYGGCKWISTGVAGIINMHGLPLWAMFSLPGGVRKTRRQLSFSQLAALVFWGNLTDISYHVNSSIVHTVGRVCALY